MSAISSLTKEINVILLLQQHWLSNEQAWLRFQQVGPKSKQGGLSPPRATPHFNHCLQFIDDIWIFCRRKSD